jgi:hypothetical protein
MRTHRLYEYSAWPTCIVYGNAAGLAGAAAHRAFHALVPTSARRDGIVRRAGGL